MFPFFDILILLIKSLPLALFNPFFWIVILIIWMQYRKTAKFEENMFGEIQRRPEEKVLYALLLGVIGGLIGSLAVIILGLSVANAGLKYVWPIALLLMLVHPRFICFSYAGGIVSLFSLITGKLNVDVAGLMALVAVLHLVESLLIYFGGYLNASPVYVKDDRYGIIGGFSLQEFWPVPIILLTIVSADIPMEGMVSMPDWWPLLKPPGYIMQSNPIFMMIPVVAALGYGDIALTTIPKVRCRKTGINLFIFSIILLFLSIMASRYLLFAYLAAIFGPVAHEILIYLGKKSEKKSLPLFKAPDFGEMILDVIKGSEAERIGLKSGDIILNINGKDLVDNNDYENIMNEFPAYIWLKYKTLDGEVKTGEIKAFPYGTNQIGVILVPKNRSVSYVVTEAISFVDKIKKFLKKFFK